MALKIFEGNDLFCILGGFFCLGGEGRGEREKETRVVRAKNFDFKGELLVEVCPNIPTNLLFDKCRLCIYVKAEFGEQVAGDEEGVFGEEEEEGGVGDAGDGFLQESSCGEEGIVDPMAVGRGKGRGGQQGGRRRWRLLRS